METSDKNLIIIRLDWDKRRVYTTESGVYIVKKFNFKKLIIPAQTEADRGNHLPWNISVLGSTSKPNYILSEHGFVGESSDVSSSPEELSFKTGYTIYDQIVKRFINGK